MVPKKDHKDQKLFRLISLWLDSHSIHSFAKISSRIRFEIRFKIRSKIRFKIRSKIRFEIRSKIRSNLSKFRSLLAHLGPVYKA